MDDDNSGDADYTVEDCQPSPEAFQPSTEPPPIELQCSLTQL